MSGLPGLDSFARKYSREFLLACDEAGFVTFADDRALHLLGAGVGRDLRTFAPDGAGEKLAALLARARSETVEGWELSFVIGGKALTVLANAGPVEGGIGLHCSLIPSDYSLALDQVSETMGELGNLNREIGRQKRELESRHAELNRVHQELSDSNRGVVALYAELDHKAEALHHSAEVKGRLVANVSHEFRTPLNSILGLSRLLLGKGDGPLNAEQEKQLGFIVKSAEELSLMVNDMLDLAKLEAGAMRLRTAPFTAGNLLAGLRGMFKPMVKEGQVALIVDDAAGVATLDTDEGKVSQILRNLLSNSLKFTEKGHVKVTARKDGERVIFEVEDTGVGIPPEHHEAVFEEFHQLEGPHQRKVKGTGLGLSLSRKLAELLGGTLKVTRGEAGVGTTFQLDIPAQHPEVAEMGQMAKRAERVVPGHAPVLVVEDDRQTLFLYEKYLQGSGFQVIPARSIDAAREVMKKVQPSAIVLDVMLEAESTWSFLSDIKEDVRTRDIPVMVVTVMDKEQKARALGADEFWLKPIDQGTLLRRLKQFGERREMSRVLVIDDDEVSRYLVRRLLSDAPYQVLEAADGQEGVRRARQELPHVILLDFVLPGMSAFEVLDELKTDPSTRAIPVIIHTSKRLEEEERTRLQRESAAILNKQGLSREIAIGRIREALLQAGVGGTPQGGATHG